MNKLDLVELQNLNKEIEELTEDLKARKELFDKKNEKIVNEISSLNEKQAKLKEGISQDALSEFKESGEKKLLGGIGIRETSKISYDPKQAMDWAIANTMCLQLDKKKFEKVAPELVDFITVKKVASVTFPKVLKLEEAEDEN